MNNTILVAHPRRNSLKLAISILLIYAVIFLVLLPLVVSINRNNYNGQTIDLVGVVEKVTESDDIFLITVEKDDTSFSTASLDIEYNWKSLVGKTVTFTVPLKTYGEKSVVQILGAKCNGQTIADAETTIEINLAENKEIITVLAIITAILCTATCALVIWRINTPHTKGYSVAFMLAQFYASTKRQPPCKQKKTVTIYTAVAYSAWVIVLMIWLILGIVKDDILTVFAIIVAALLAVITALDIFLNYWALKQDIKHYAKNFPFDNTDLSGIPLRKSTKEEFQNKLKEERALYPNAFNDDGNGLKIVFTESGVELSNPEPDDEESDDPFLAGAQFEDPFEETMQTKKPFVKLDYEQLHFEAVPFYFKKAPLIVVIKSRLESFENTSEEVLVENDIHIVLDSNLMKTLEAFNVSVEGLQDILENKAQLMNSHCFRIKPNN